MENCFGSVFTILRCYQFVVHTSCLDVRDVSWRITRIHIKDGIGGAVYRNERWRKGAW